MSLAINCHQKAFVFGRLYTVVRTFLLSEAINFFWNLDHNQRYKEERESQAIAETKSFKIFQDFSAEGERYMISSTKNIVCK